MTKTCPKCKETYPMDGFYKRAISPDGRKIYCIKCDKIAKKAYVDSRRQQAVKFKITVEQLKEMADAGCSICKTTEGRLVVDHDHDCCDRDGSCGKCVRGILCSNCNKGLGMFEDNVDKLEKAIAYLQKFSGY